MNDMEKRKLWLRYSLAHDKMVDNKKPCIESFPKSNGTIRWNQTRYGVFADDLIKSGVNRRSSCSCFTHDSRRY